MQFIKYNSIENAYQEDFIRSIHIQGFAVLEYVVQEKVHGANLSFMTDGQNILAAKRTELLSDNENFFHSKGVQNNIQHKLLALHQELSTQLGVKTITVFGEVFGGSYPHPDVPRDKDAQLVQKNIYYSPGNDFFAFDILVDHETYLDVPMTAGLLEKFGFVYAKTLFSGSLKDCLAYPNQFKTTIPAQLGLPEIEGNFCEGVIIKPVHASFLRSGARIMIKNKNEKWAENKKYIDKAQLGIIQKEHEELSEEARLLCEEMAKFITMNRLSNVISKIGEVNPQKDAGKILGLFSKDALTDFLKMHKQEYDSLEKHESRAVNKFLNKHAGQMIYDFFYK